MASPSEALPKLLETPLAELHRQLGARMVYFAGWNMPLQYGTGILAEHQAVRSGVGLFDLSHMGRVHLRGRDAFKLAQACTTRDLTRIPEGEAAYALLCQPDGGIVDDVIVSVLDEADILFVVNASNRLIDFDLFSSERHRLHLDVELEDRTLQTALLGLQGPRAQAVLDALGVAGLDSLPGYAFLQTTVAGVQTLISRTGYTGEDGFELLVEAAAAVNLWKSLQDGGAIPAGLGARDTLRTEACYPLYGHDIDRTTNPFEARLGWVVDLAKESFIGRDALAHIKATAPVRRLVGLHVGPGGVPRQGFPILSQDRAVGQLTTGTFSPTLKRNIGLGYVPIELAAVGQRLEVETRGKRIETEVVSLPFVRHRTRPRATI